MSWWERGPYRVVVTRQVSDEETVSLEMIHTQYVNAATEAEAFVRVCHSLMIEYNERVVQVHREQLRLLNEQIAERSAAYEALAASHTNGREP